MFCEAFPDIQFFIFTKHVPSLLYYSHIPTALTALLIGFFIYVKSNRNQLSKILLSITLIFLLWVIFNLIAWTNPDSRMVMFLWSFFPVIYVLLYVLCLYFVYVFVDKKDISPKLKSVFALILLPVILLYATNIHLNGFNVVSCEAVEQSGFILFYYGVSAIIFLWILVFGIHRFFKEKLGDARRQIALLIFGIELFLLSFFSSSALATYIDNFELEQYGLFGMVVFMGFLGYLIVQYKAFDVKIFGAQALIFALAVLIGAQFFYSKNPTNLALNAIAFVLTLFAGYFLIKSVGLEVKRKEELQKISDSLAVANERLKELDNAKSEFISIASHQLRTPLTAIKGYVSLILEGSYGKVPAQIQDVLNKVYSVNDRLAHLVEDLLNVSRIEAGRIQYNFQPTQIEELVAELVDTFLVTSKAKHLELKISLPKHSLPKLLVDPNKIKEVTSNLIDNALKYTKEGSVIVSVIGLEGKLRIEIKDTGIGINPEDKEHLFEKFVRSKETTRMVVNGAGLGLYVGKNFIVAHGGKIWAESEGPGKGSTFIIELPFVNPNVKAGVSDQ